MFLFLSLIISCSQASNEFALRLKDVGQSIVKDSSSPFSWFESNQVTEKLLIKYGVRGFERKLKTDSEESGEWVGFRSFLEQIKKFHYSHLHHEPITLYLKPSLDEQHSITDLETLVQEEVGPFQYRPADQMEACLRSNFLRDCAWQQKTKWFALDDLRGRLLVVVEFKQSEDWLRYSRVRDIRTRAFFPMTTELVFNEYLKEPWARDNTLFLRSAEKSTFDDFLKQSSILAEINWNEKKRSHIKPEPSRPFYRLDTGERIEEPQLKK